MTDAPGAGAPPAAPEAAVTPAATIEAPEPKATPIESAGPEKAPEPKAEPAKPSASVKDAIAKADAKLKEADTAKAKEPAKEAPKAEAKPQDKDKAEAKTEPVKAEAKTEAKVEAKEPPKPVRDETGKFASTKEPEQAPDKPSAFRDAPRGYDDAAKADWEKVPESVRGATYRRINQLETGITEYQKVVEPLKPYLQMAQQYNTTVDKALERYTGLERALVSQDKAVKQSALYEVFETAGISPREWAAQLLNVPSEQVRVQNEAETQQMRSRVAELERENTALKQAQHERTYNDNLTHVQSFAETHPRFEELSSEIALEIKLLKQAQPDIDQKELLEMAYRRADRLNPAPAGPSSAAEPVSPAQPLVAQTDKGTKSISGAPSSGSSPSKRGPSPSIRDALRSAMSRAS